MQVILVACFNVDIQVCEVCQLFVSLFIDVNFGACLEQLLDSSNVVLHHLKPATSTY